MKTLDGIEIKKQDLKQENGKYTFLEQLKNLQKDNKQSQSQDWNEQLFVKYDHLLITPDDEIKGVKEQDLSQLDNIPGAFAAAQSLFGSG